ncbi:flagellar biosynthesis protein FlhB [bacterium]|nr:flagellar biosynthesis protein FlhB [bacterium]
MAENNAERTEKATPKRREEARKKGNVARSMELSSATILLGGTLTLFFSAKLLFGSVRLFMQRIFTEVGCFELNPENVQSLILSTMLFLAKALAPLVLSLIIIGILVNFAQVGIVFSAEILTPDANKINPISGLKRLFSLKAAMELLKGILKIVLVACVVYLTIKSKVRSFFPLMDAGVGQIVSFFSTGIFQIAIRSSVALLVLAVMDYGFQKWDYERNLRMTKQEVKEEFKQHEGDPLIKSRIRSLQREMARRRMMAEVPKADVVITNPVHLAVALKYDAATMTAPTVLAKGKRKIAEKIKTIAQEHGIPIVENVELAQVLFKTTEIGMEIPAELYRSVAEILAYIYRLNQSKAVG